MNVEIPAELNHFVREMILTGGYRDENELVIEGLRLLKSREQLRRDVNAGIDQLEAGKGIDGEKVFARLEARAAKIAQGRAE